MKESINPLGILATIYAFIAGYLEMLTEGMNLVDYGTLGVAILSMIYLTTKIIINVKQLKK